MRVKKIILSLLLTAVFTSVGLIFWHSEFVYSLPTPVPKNYRSVAIGSIIPMRESFNFKSNKPVFLHFFNPDCPCSRFNISHFKSLVKQYSNRATFAMVVMSNKNYTKKQIQEKFQLNIPVLFDTAIAVSCGVYSTPQAVLIDTAGKLYYRGNYNRSRYCSVAKSAYAHQALESLLNKSDNTNFNTYALTAYGCRLPVCKNN